MRATQPHLFVLACIFQLTCSQGLAFVSPYQLIGLKQDSKSRVEVLEYVQKKKGVILKSSLKDDADTLEMAGRGRAFSSGILKLTKRNNEGELVHQGTLFRVGANLFLTNRHVLEIDGEVECLLSHLSSELPGYEKVIFTCEVVGCLKKLDSCLVRLRTDNQGQDLLDNSEILTLGRLDFSQEVGQLSHIGNARGRGLFISIGEGANRVGQKIAHHCASAKGMSGGPTLDEGGYVVGLNVSKVKDPIKLEQTHGFSLDMSVLIPLIRRDIGEDVYQQLQMTEDLRNYTNSLFKRN